VTVDLCTVDREGDAVPPCEPRTRRRRVDRQPWRPLHVAVRYAECEVEPLPVLEGSGETIEFASVKESFAVRVFEELPGTPWVTLADVLLDPAMQVSSVDCETSRRLVPSPSS
jgi:hypothetical protein